MASYALAAGGASASWGGITLVSRAQQERALRASWWDEELRYFVGPSSTTLEGETGFAYLIRNGIQATLAGWTDPDTGTPAPWTEITTRVYWRSTFASRLQGGAIIWEATLQGETYDDDLLGLEQAVVCWRRVWTPSEGWLPWAIHFVGQFIRSEGSIDFQAGGEWRRTVQGLSRSLDRHNSIRLVAGPLQVTGGASVSVKDNDVLTDPAQEQYSGEYVGALADVQPANLVDSKLRTVYISSSTPSSTEYPVEAAQPDGSGQVSEVFFAPAAGYSVAQCWWIEIYCHRDHDGQGLEGQSVWSAVYSGGDYTVKHIHIPKEHLTLAPNAWAVVCGNRAAFDAYTGGAPNATVIDASIYPVHNAAHIEIPGEVFSISQTDGWVTLGTTDSTVGMIWSPASAPRDALGRAGIIPFDSDQIAPTSGYSIRRTLQAGTMPSLPADVNSLAPDGTEAYHNLNIYPSPGAKSLHVDEVAIRVVLPENESRLTQGIGTESTTIQLDNYLGFIAPGQVVCESDVIDYTGRDSTGLTGVTNIAVEHQAGARVYPYVSITKHGVTAAAAQTGYPLNRIGWQRRKTPTLDKFRLYWSDQGDARQYDEPGYRNDYYDQEINVGANTALTFNTAWTAAIWIRTLLMLIQKMSDSGRAKLNEITASVAQTALDWSGLADLDGSRSASLAFYLLHDYYGLLDADWHDDSSTALHQLGIFALGIQPLTKVLGDLAKATGCLFHPAPDGIAYWLDDPRWPLGLPPTTAGISADVWALTADCWRGKLQFSDDSIAVDCVILNSLVLQSDGTAYPYRVVYPPPIYPATEPPAGSQVEEISDYVVSSETDARLVAEYEWLARRLQGEVTMALVGPAIWARAGILVRLTSDFGAGIECRSYIIAALTIERTGAGAARDCVYRLQLARVP
jgi:hypothetical protein